MMLELVKPFVDYLNDYDPFEQIREVSLLCLRYSSSSMKRKKEERDEKRFSFIIDRERDRLFAHASRSCPFSSVRDEHSSLSILFKLGDLYQFSPLSICQAEYCSFFSSNTFENFSTTRLIDCCYPVDHTRTFN